VTLEDAKQEVLRLIGPESQLVEAMNKRGLTVYDWEDDGRIIIRFNLTPIIFDIDTVNLNLMLCGRNVRLELENWKCDWNNEKQKHDCFAVFTTIYASK
jgi:hypothetical protein